MSNYVINSVTGDAHKNLALDEYILKLYHDGSMNGVALYYFVNSSAVIIGRNQNAWRECDLDSMRRDGVQLVRRHTGGGAVYHDEGNLNFSFITDEKHYDSARQTAVVMNACRKLGVETELSGRNDILASGRKFSGNAYAVWGRARGQHGTLLVDTDLQRLSRYLNVSKQKLEAKGITSVKSRVCNLKELAPHITVEGIRNAITESFIEEYGSAEFIDPSEFENSELQALFDKQCSWEWQLGKTPVFDYKLEHRFSFGELQMLLSIKEGVIANAKVFTDALDTSVAERLSGLVMGSRFAAEDLCSCLKGQGAEANELACYIENWGL